MDSFWILCFMFVLSTHCSLAITCWVKFDLLALLFVVFSYVFITLPYGVLGQAWYLIVLIPDFYLPLYLDSIGLLKLDVLLNFFISQIGNPNNKRHSPRL